MRQKTRHALRGGNRGIKGVALKELSEQYFVSCGATIGAR
jgi:hypothetical protein